MATSSMKEENCWNSEFGSKLHTDNSKSLENGGDDEEDDPSWKCFAGLNTSDHARFERSEILIKFRFGFCELLLHGKTQSKAVKAQLQQIVLADFQSLDSHYVEVSANTNELDWQIFDADIKSTNELLSCRKVGVCTRCVCWLLLMSQVAIFVLICIENGSSTIVRARTVELILVRIFIAIMVSMRLGSNFSDLVWKGVNWIHEIERDVQNMNFGTVVFGMLMFPWLISLCAIVYPLGAGSKSCLAWCMENKPYWEDAAKAVVCSEILLNAAMAFATAIVVKQQSRMVDSIFSFISLLLVLDLDRYAARFFNYELKILRIHNATGRNPSKHLKQFLSFSCGLYVFVVTVIYLLV